MKKTTFKISGFKELERALAEDLPKVTARNVLRRTAENALQLIEDEAKARAPLQDGILRDSIKTQLVPTKFVSRNKRARSSGIAMKTGPSFVNVSIVQRDGSERKRPHAVPGWQERGTVHQPAQPFMRPAADAEGENVIAVVRDELAGQIDKAKARIARKAARQK